MKITCGTDIIEVDRIEKAINSTEGFKTRIFTEKEIEYCEKSKVTQYQHFAGRFSAKEAVYKAISNNMPKEYTFNWKDVEITNEENGRPIITLGSQLSDNIESIDLTISHIKEYATANCVVTWRE